MIVSLDNFSFYNILVLLRDCLARCRHAMEVPTISNSCVIGGSCSKYFGVYMYFIGKKYLANEIFEKIVSLIFLDAEDT
jgi:hypothetical protein